MKYEKVFKSNYNLIANETIFANIFLNCVNTWSVKFHKDDAPYIFKTRKEAMNFAEEDYRVKYHAHDEEIKRPRG